jgi:hypothetical protein
MSASKHSPQMTRVFQVSSHLTVFTALGNMLFLAKYPAIQNCRDSKKCYESARGLQDWLHTTKRSLPACLCIQTHSIKQCGHSNACFWEIQQRGVGHAGVSIVGFVPTATALEPVLFRKGDVHTVLAQMLSQQAGRNIPSGHLAVTWQRSR